MILTIIQARMSSERLPGKVLLPIAGKPIVQHVYDAAPEPKVVATSFDESDEPLVNFCCENSIIVYRGSLDDVLSRFYNVWRDCEPKAEWILRLTADCPMLTKEIVNRFIEAVKASGLRGETIFTNRPWDYDGYDMELFSADMLKWAYQQATDDYDREHVTPWIYRHFNVIRYKRFFHKNPDFDRPEDKVSVDTLEDYEKVKKLMEEK